MPSKTFRKNAMLRSIEYQVTELDANGEIIDVNGYESKAEAVKYAEMLIERGAVAVAIEHHTQYWPAHLVDEPDRYATIATYGDESALHDGGWTT